MEKTYYLSELQREAREDLQDRIQWYEKDGQVKEKDYYEDDLISEVSDNNTPIYTYDLLQYASNNFDLIQPNDLAGDDTDVVSIIQANIYELLMEDLYDYLEEKFQQERKVGWIEAINSGLKPSESPEITKRTKGE